MQEGNILKCPACGNKKELVTERKMFGYTRCSYCEYMDKTEFFEIKNQKDSMVELNNFYLNGLGEIIYIVRYEDWYFRDLNGNPYTRDGRFKGNPTELDLIAEVPKELHCEILNKIKDYYEN